MIAYRTATRAELDILLGWAAEEGWNPGREDAAAFFAADPDGFFVATEGAAPVAGISVVRHNNAFAFLGLYIVRPAWRGRGIGFGLWRHALEHAGDRVVGLDGVPAQQANYAASGFRHAGGTTRYSGSVSPQKAAEVRFAHAEDVPHLIADEARCSGQSKPAYLGPWFAASDTRKTLVRQIGGDVSGFCTVRDCLEGAKIGPFVAEDATAARALLHHAATLWDGPMIIDVPASSGALAALCQEYGFSAGFETARMYRGGFAPDPHPFFAVGTLELG